ncbi:hypothetical protein CEW91_00315 [Idiomarina piscisalsi]|uniref:HemY N-terminal domain-containing protein n=1 Tax=Idiomarina piscisalsi TaxID=1096243 RepID=A0ABN5AM80_9GAMM|nr:heme biosynthesis HemY N-terminal domain-containing protein [Idiomarina piscisalsi]ASG64689.1 hypothetical protein CEW91_00315 [Idiomarina piscisalsi]
MKWLIALVVLLIIGAVLGPAASGNAGYVLIQFAGWSIEATVVGLIVVVVAAALIAAVAISILRRLLSKTQRGAAWFSNRSDRKAKQLYEEGIRLLLDDSAEAASLRFASSYKKRPIQETAAMAALASCLANDTGKAQYWHEEAGDFAKGSDTLLSILKVSQQVNNDPHSADTAVQELLDKHPNSAHVAFLAKTAYKASGNYKALKDLLPKLKQHAELSPAEFERLEYDVYLDYFVSIGRNGNDALKDAWQSLSSKQRGDATTRLAYAAALKHLGEQELSAKVILKGLKREDIHPSGVNALKLFNGKYAKLVEFVQEKLKQNPDDKDYLYAFALIAMDNQDYSLAQRALKKLVDVEPNAKTYRLLGDAYYALGDSQLAANAYKQALAD